MVQQQQQQLELLLAAVTEKSAAIRRTHPGGFFPELDVVSEVLLLTIGWALLFTVLRYFVFSRLSYDFNNRLVSVIHCLVVFPLALQTLDWNDPLGNVGGFSTEKEVCQKLGVQRQLPSAEKLHICPTAMRALRFKS